MIPTEGEARGSDFRRMVGLRTYLRIRWTYWWLTHVTDPLIDRFGKSLDCGCVALFGRIMVFTSDCRIHLKDWLK